MNAHRRCIIGYTLLGMAFALCPCHLPIVLFLLAGTAIGALLLENFSMIMLLAAALFLVLLITGILLIRESTPETKSHHHWSAFKEEYERVDEKV
jgi:H+/Cl- antiporter ClcA